MGRQVYIALWSGGKDSSAMLIEVLERKLPLDLVVTYNTPDFNEMVEYKRLFTSYIKEKYNRDIVTIETGGMDTVYKWSYGRYVRGKHKGMVRGFPLYSGVSWCTRELKVYPYNRFIRKHFNKDDNIYKYYGIAADEPRRLHKDPNGIYLLNDLGMSEKDCLDYLKSLNLHNPLYNHFDRTGCWFCPKTKPVENWVKIKKYYPKQWEELIRWGEEIAILDNVHYNTFTELPGGVKATVQDLCNWVNGF